jgi:hypothetical protein
MRSLIRAGALVLALWQLGCGPPGAVRRDWNRQGGVSALLSASASTHLLLEDLTAEVRIELRQGEEKSSAMASLLYKRPGFFRLDVRGPLLFTHVLTALIRGDSLTVLAQGKRWQSEDSGQLLARLTGIDLGMYDVAYALIGLLEPGRIDPEAAAVYPRADHAIITLDDGVGFGRRLWLDLDEGFATREEARFDGMLLWRRDLEDYRLLATDPRGDLYLPKEVQITQRDMSIQLIYRNHLVNSGLSEQAFTRGIPVDDGSRE